MKINLLLKDSKNTLIECIHIHSKTNRIVQAKNIFTFYYKIGDQRYGPECCRNDRGIEFCERVSTGDQQQGI